MEPRNLLDVLLDLKECIYYLWQPLLAAVLVKLGTLSWGKCKYNLLRAFDWLATWILVGIILLIVTTAVR